MHVMVGCASDCFIRKYKEFVMYTVIIIHLHTLTIWSPPPDASLFVAVTGAFGPP